MTKRHWRMLCFERMPTLCLQPMRYQYQLVGRKNMARYRRRVHGNLLRIWTLKWRIAIDMRVFRTLLYIGSIYAVWMCNDSWGSWDSHPKVNTRNSSCREKHLHSEK